MTDYIRKEYENVLGDFNTEIHSLGVLPFFEMLRQDNLQNETLPPSPPHKMKHYPRPPSERLDSMEQFYFDSPIGRLCLEEENKKITGIYVTEEGSIEDSSIKTDTYNKPATELLKKAYTQLQEYFDGTRKTFDLPLEFHGTDFQIKVWEALQTIPYGQTCSYQDIATKIGNPKAVRAVGGANNKNRIMIVVPCHRVVGKNGALVGFGVGLPAKEYLLNLEMENA